MNPFGTQAAVQHLASEPKLEHNAARHPETGRILLSCCYRPVFGSGDTLIIAALIDAVIPSYSNYLVCSNDRETGKDFIQGNR